MFRRKNHSPEKLAFMQTIDANNTFLVLFFFPYKTIDRGGSSTEEALHLFPLFPSLFVSFEKFQCPLIRKDHKNVGLPDIQLLKTK